MKKIVGLFLIALAGGAMALGLNTLFEKKPHLQSSLGPEIPVKQVAFTPAGNLPEMRDAVGGQGDAAILILGFCGFST